MTYEPKANQLKPRVTSFRVLQSPAMHPAGSIDGPISFHLDFRRRDGAEPGIETLRRRA